MKEKTKNIAVSLLKLLCAFVFSTQVAVYLNVNKLISARYQEVWFYNFPVYVTIFTTQFWHFPLWHLTPSDVSRVCCVCQTEVTPLLCFPNSNKAALFCFRFRVPLSTYFNRRRWQPLLFHTKVNTTVFQTFHAFTLLIPDLRKQARHLENDIDLKLVAFSKLAAGINTPHGGSSDTVPLLSGEDTFEAMALEIQDLLSKVGLNVSIVCFERFCQSCVEFCRLFWEISSRLCRDLSIVLNNVFLSPSPFLANSCPQKLTQINERMSEQPVSGATMLHTLQRHRDILADLSRDFRKTNSQREARREREDLLHGGKTDGFRTEGINNRRDVYLKENTHIHKWDVYIWWIKSHGLKCCLCRFSSDRLVNEQIAIAMETREHLTSQRHTLKKLQTRFNDISNRFPIINSLVQRINLRKRRDSIIVGLVVAACTFLMLLYIFR